MGETTRVWPTIAYEAITVSTTAIGFTAATYTKKAKRAVCLLEGTAAKGMRYRTDGTDPTATVGMLIYPGVSTYGTGPVMFAIDGIKDISRFKAIRDNDTDCTLHVHYLGDD